MDQKIAQLARDYLPLAVWILKEAIRIPADYVDRPAEEGGDPQCGLSNHEGPRLEYLRQRIVEIGAVDGPAAVGFDTFGNLVWSVQDPADGVPPADKTVIVMDGHTDTVAALRSRWHEVLGGGLDAYLGLTDPARVDRAFLARELGYLPPEDEWDSLVWGRGAADQLGGVVCQIVATKILRELRGDGALQGVIVRSYGTVSEEENDGGGARHLMHEALNGGVDRIPDVLILTEGTGCARQGAVGIYRGQRGRMQVEVAVTGRSCHGSMPWEGLNPLEHGAAIISEAAQRHDAGEGFEDDSFLGRGSRTASQAHVETPSDCAVPERFTFRFDRRLTAGENAEGALADVDQMPSVARARQAGLTVDVRAPVYEHPTWKGTIPGNRQIYPGWVTPKDHAALQCAVETWRRAAAPLVTAEAEGGGLRKEARVSRWIFSTDGVGVPVPATEVAGVVPDRKAWVSTGSLRHPPMLGIGPGIEQNTHKIGECVDARELPLVIAFLARFPSLYRRRQER
jgi:putative selenium metabolism hydrolase